MYNTVMYPSTLFYRPFFVEAMNFIKKKTLQQTDMKQTRDSNIKIN